MVAKTRHSVDPKGRVVLAGWLIFLALAFGWILRPSLSPAQMMEGEKRRTLTVIGRSERLIAPEVAWLTLTVESRDQVASQAVADDARRTQEVMDRLRSQLGKEDKLCTLGYELFPYYDGPAGPWPMRGGWPPPGLMLREKMAGRGWRGGGEMRAIPREGMPEGEEKPPELKGYVVRNRIQLETSFLKELGALIDAAVAAGADRVEGLSFTCRQESYRQELLQEALAKAREEAEVLAKALGVRIVRVLQAAPNVTFPFPHRRPFFAEARPAWVPTPIEPEEVRVMAEATVTYEIE